MDCGCKRQTRESDSEKPLEDKAQSERGLGMRHLLALGLEEGAAVRVLGPPLEGGKHKQMGSSLEPPEGMQL